CIQGSHLPYTF
nr:immunoglobulin light chain junction region [Macaca mulatta]